MLLRLFFLFSGKQTAVFILTLRTYKYIIFFRQFMYKCNLFNKLYMYTFPSWLSKYYISKTSQGQGEELDLDGIGLIIYQHLPNIVTMLLRLEVHVSAVEYGSDRWTSLNPSYFHSETKKIFYTYPLVCDKQITTVGKLIFSLIVRIDQTKHFEIKNCFQSELHEKLPCVIASVGGCSSRADDLHP